MFVCALIKNKAAVSREVLVETDMCLGTYTVGHLLRRLCVSQ